MPCRPDHFVPLLQELREQESAYVPPRRGQHGGRRAGAGAPRGNLNAFKHGHNSRQQQRLTATLVQIPEVSQALIALAQRRRKQQRKAEAGAALLLSALLQRTGEIVLAPEDNQAKINQELLTFLRAAEASLREILEQQSSEARKKHRSIKRPGSRSS